VGHVAQVVTATVNGMAEPDSGWYKITDDGWQKMPGPPPDPFSPGFGRRTRLMDFMNRKPDTAFAIIALTLTVLFVGGGILAEFLQGRW
jgi:hypothetical protein